MDTQAIYLNPEDDLISIRDRLTWAKESRLVLVLPDDGDLFTNYLDLVLLRRHADTNRLEIGLITSDSRVSGPAQNIGFPVFSSLEASVINQRRWWRGRGKREYIGRPINLDREDKIEVERRKSPRPTWQQWLLRFGAILLYLFTLAVLFVAAVYTVPGATITLRPLVELVEVKRQIVADPFLESIDASGASVPGRVLKTVQGWRADLQTSGWILVPDSPARGRVVFVNRLAQPVVVPAGTRVSTTGGTRIIFQTLEAVDVPGVVGATASADVVAIEPGPGGNVEANLINRIEGPLAIQLQVRNLENTEGGFSRQELAVTEADQERLRSQIMQHLQVRALADMEGRLADGEFLARDSLQVVRILHETNSHFPGEKTERLTMELRAELQATAVNRSQAVDLVYGDLTSVVHPGFELEPSTLQLTEGDVIGTDAEGRVTFELTASALTVAKLALEESLAQVSGQELGLASVYLVERLPLQDYPSINVWPSWFNHMPYLPARIRVRVEIRPQ